MKTLISIVAPVYNEEDCLEEYYRTLCPVLEALDVEVELIFVNDGSKDKSSEILEQLHLKDSRVKIINFARNFGHQIAIKSGIDNSAGDAVITMDTDLQDPADVIPAMIARWREGYDVVYAVRKERAGESFFKKITAAIYYRVIRYLANIDIPLDAGDFRLISKPVVEALKGIQEKNLYLRGLISWLGFRHTGVVMQRQARYKGKTKYSLIKMIRLAWNGITHFSFVPLQFATMMGILTFLVCLIWSIHILYVTFILRVAVPGWASIMISILFLGSVQLITLGILGSYLAKNYDESRKRPLYVIREKKGF